MAELLIGLQLDKNRDSMRVRDSPLVPLEGSLVCIMKCLCTHSGWLDPLKGPYRVTVGREPSGNADDNWMVAMHVIFQTSLKHVFSEPWDPNWSYQESLGWSPSWASRPKPGVLMGNEPRALRLCRIIRECISMARGMYFAMLNTPARKDKTPVTTGSFGPFPVWALSKYGR